MRLRRVVARAALIAVLASVVVSGLVGSRTPSAPSAIDPSAYQAVGVDHTLTSMTTLQLDPEQRSAGRLDAGDVLSEPGTFPGDTVTPRPVVSLPNPPLIQEIWKFDPDISWYGPGFWGQHTACGQILEPNTIGVAHRTLPCGTRVTFRYNGLTVVARVIDRGPYVSGRTWDLTKATCLAIAHCFTGGGVYYHIG